MQYLKFADCVSDSTKFMIKEGSELDGIIKECTEEVSPLRVGVCCLTDPKQIGGADRTPYQHQIRCEIFQHSQQRHDVRLRS